MSNPNPIDAPQVAVSAHRDGFRRGGRAWTIQPQRVRVVADGADVAADEITESQLAQLERDPNIAVVSTTDADANEPSEDLAKARAAHLRTATRLAPEGAERTQAGQLTTAWLESATGLDGVTAAERDAAAEDAEAEAV